MPTIRRPLSLLTVLLLLLTQATSALAQATPETTPAGDYDVLAEMRVDTLPTPHAEVWFIRFSLEPGGSLPLGKQLGPTILYVESGDLTVIAGAPPVGEPATPGGRPEKAFGAGEPLLFVAGEEVSLRNAGDQPVSFLALLMFSGEAESEAMEESTQMPEPVGLTQQPIGITQAEFEAVPATVTFERLTVPAGGQVTSETRAGGAEAGGVETGDVTMDLVSGQCFIWPQTMVPFSDEATPVGTPPEFAGPQRLVAGDTSTLSANDGYGCHDATMTWHGGAAPATILRARIVPESTASPAAQPGTTVPATPVSVEPGVLAEVPIPELPTPHAEVWFIRFFLEPGGSLPADRQVGPTIVTMESGELTLVADQPLSLSHPGSTTSAPEGETILRPGETALVPGGTTLAARNDGDSPAVFLGLLMFSGMAESEAMEEEDAGDEPVGLSQQPIAVTQVEFPAAPGSVVIERIAIEPGATVTSGVGMGGAEVGALEAGGATLTLSAGHCFLWPQMLIMDPDGGPAAQGEPRRNELDAGDSADLVANDGYGCRDTSAAWQGGDETTLILRARIVPMTGATPEATPLS